MFNETNASPSYHTLIINVLTRITRARKTKREGKNIKLVEEERTDTVCVSTALYTPGRRVAR